MIRQQLTDNIKDAMRAKEAMKLETLRYVLSQIKYSEIDKKRELSDEEIISVLSTEVKKRKDAIELFKNSGRDGLVADEEVKLAVIYTLLPAQMSKEEVEALVDEILASGTEKNMGAVMKALQPQVKGKADGRMVSEIVKQKLS